MRDRNIIIFIHTQIQPLNNISLTSVTSRQNISAEQGKKPLMTHLIPQLLNQIEQIW